MKTTHLLSLLFFLFYSTSGSVWAQGQIGAAILGEAANDQAGYDVSMPNANVIAIGEIRDDNVNGIDAGRVRIFEWNGSSWNQKGADLLGENAGDLFGISVYMPDDNTIAVGAAGNDNANGTDAGRAQIFEWNGSAWVQKGGNIDGDNPQDFFGVSTSMPNSDAIAIGAFRNDNVNGINASHVRVYTWDSGSSTWIQKGAAINGESGGDEFGFSVSMPDVNTVAGGAIGNSGGGQARVFSWDSGSSSWVPKGTEISGEASGDQAGSSVNMPDANTIAVGAQSNDGNGSNSGHARVFTWDSSSAAWVQKGADIDGAAPGDLFGRCVRMPDANTLAVGGYRNDGNGQDAGHARVFDWNSTSSTWVQRGMDIQGEAILDQAGFGMSMPDANTLAVGAVGHDANASNAGHARVFDLSEREINLSGNKNTILNGQTTISNADGTDFGSTCVNGGTVTRTFSIENTGGLTLTINSISSSDARFSISGPPSSVAGRSSATFDITFDPSTVSTFTSTITINNDDADEGNYTFQIEGQGVPNIVTDSRDDALDFDGTDDYVDIGNILENQVELTLEAWIYPQSSTGYGDIISHRYVAAIAYDHATNRLEAVYGDGASWAASLQSTNTIPYNQWTHVAATRDASGNITLYINGVANGTATNNNTGANAETASIGASCGGTCQYFTGQLDEARIWNIARTASEIRQNIHLTTKNCPTGLLAYYQMSDGTGSSSLSDGSGNGNSGTLNNMNVTNDWLASGVNVGNDASSASNSQSLSVPMGASTQNFASANLSIDFLEHDAAEDFTVTYQAFTPNITTGANGVTVFDNPTWTINKATATSSQNFNVTFTLPAGTYPTDGTKYRLLWRPMYSDGAWAVVKGQAASVSSNDITFENLFETGQFMVEQFSANEVSDVRGNMYSFDGSNDHIDLGAADDLEGLSALTLEAWVKLENTSNFRSLLETNDVSSQATALEAENGFVRFYSAGAYFQNSSALAVNQWTHLAATFDGSSLRLYVNGELQTGTLNGSLGTNLAASFANNLFLGAENGTSQFFEGAIDEVRIWSVARTHAQIRENMHLTLRGDETGLLRYYQFNNDGPINTASAVLDASANNRDGQTQNIAAANYVPSQVAVAGGVSQQILAGALTATTDFTETGVSITFNTVPADDIVVYRLQTEPPVGITGINDGYALDDQYYVIRNFGTATPDVTAINFEEIGYVAAADVGVAGAFELYKRPSNSFSPADWALANAGGTNGQATASGPAAPVDFPASFSGFSQFIILNSSGNSTLPIELLDFQAQRATAMQVALNWSTATEISASHFEVERMLDNAEVFTKVGEVAAAGNSNSFQAYAFQDANAHQGLSYYRLKQVDEDGSFEYSEIRAVAGKELDRQIAVFPNPVDDVLKLRLSDLNEQQQVDVRIVNSLGQVVFQGQRTFGQADVVEIREVADLVPGAYYLQLNWRAEQVALPFVKR